MEGAAAGASSQKARLSNKAVPITAAPITHAGAETTTTTRAAPATTEDRGSRLWWWRFTAAGAPEDEKQVPNPETEIGIDTETGTAGRE